MSNRKTTAGQKQRSAASNEERSTPSGDSPTSASESATTKKSPAKSVPAKKATAKKAPAKKTAVKKTASGTATPSAAKKTAAKARPPAPRPSAKIGSAARVPSKKSAPAKKANPKPSSVETASDTSQIDEDTLLEHKPVDDVTPDATTSSPAPAENDESVTDTVETAHVQVAVEEADIETGTPGPDPTTDDAPVPVVESAPEETPASENSEAPEPEVEEAQGIESDAAQDAPKADTTSPAATDAPADAATAPSETESASKPSTTAAATTAPAKKKSATKKKTEAIVVDSPSSAESGHGASSDEPAAEPSVSTDATASEPEPTDATAPEPSDPTDTTAPEPSDSVAPAPDDAPDDGDDTEPSDASAGDDEDIEVTVVRAPKKPARPTAKKSARGRIGFPLPKTGPGATPEPHTPAPTFDDDFDDATTLRGSSPVSDDTIRRTEPAAKTEAIPVPAVTESIPIAAVTEALPIPGAASGSFDESTWDVEGTWNLRNGRPAQTSRPRPGGSAVLDPNRPQKVRLKHARWPRIVGACMLMLLVVGLAAVGVLYGQGVFASSEERTCSADSSLQDYEACVALWPDNLVDQFPENIPTAASVPLFNQIMPTDGTPAHVQLNIVVNDADTFTEMSNELYAKATAVYSKNNGNPYGGGGTIGTHVPQVDGMPTANFYTNRQITQGTDPLTFQDDFDMLVFDPIQAHPEQPGATLEGTHGTSHGVAISLLRKEIVYYAEQW